MRIDGRTLDFVVDSCGIDGRTVFVVGRPADSTADPGQQILQAAVGFADQRHQDIDLDAVAVTVDLSATDRVGAIGPESLDRLGGTPPAPGTDRVSATAGQPHHDPGRSRASHDGQQGHG